PLVVEDAERLGLEIEGAACRRNEPRRARGGYPLRGRLLPEKAQRVVGLLRRAQAESARSRLLDEPALQSAERRREKGRHADSEEKWSHFGFARGPRRRCCWHGPAVRDNSPGSV